jgi:hypothetical protein
MADAECPTTSASLRMLQRRPCHRLVPCRQNPCLQDALHAKYFEDAPFGLINKPLESMSPETFSPFEASCLHPILFDWIFCNDNTPAAAGTTCARRAIRCCIVLDAVQSFRVAVSSSVNSSRLAGVSAPIPFLLGWKISIHYCPVKKRIDA